jgi:hypothetical protein
VHRSLRAVLVGLLLAPGGVANATAATCCEPDGALATPERAGVAVFGDVDPPVRRSPSGPASSMPKVEPRLPGPVPMPDVEPRRPGPVPPLTVQPPGSLAGLPLERPGQRRADRALRGPAGAALPR